MLKTFVPKNYLSEQVWMPGKKGGAGGYHWKGLEAAKVAGAGGGNTKAAKASAKKAANAHANNLIPIVCVGETLAEREANITEMVVETQLRGSLAGLTAEQVESTVLAYEPVWAIGTGKTASSAQAQEVHAFIRKVLVSMHGEAIARRVRIQYGGSVKGSNARELLQQPDIDGALVGGASLESKGFVEIIKNSI